MLGLVGVGIVITTSDFAGKLTSGIGRRRTSVVVVVVVVVSSSSISDMDVDSKIGMGLGLNWDGIPGDTRWVGASRNKLLLEGLGLGECHCQSWEMGIVTKGNSIQE